MKVLGIKKKGQLPIYVFLFIMGIIVVICGIMAIIKEQAYGMIFAIISGVLFIILGLTYIIIIVKTPEEVIKYDYDHQLLIVCNQKIYLNEILNVYYKKARAKHFEYQFGDIIFETNKGVFKARFVSNCQKVANEIHELVVLNSNY